MFKPKIPPISEVDPDLLPILTAQRKRAEARPPMEALDPKEMRSRAADEFVPWNSQPEAVDSISDVMVDTPDRQIAVRIYDHAPLQSHGALVWLHGGGWMVGDLEFEDAALRKLARKSGVRIFSVDYRLAPEHPFPAATDDASAVVRWLVNAASEFQIDANRIGIGGASAGANLALGTALHLRDSGFSRLAFLLLMYGAYSGTTKSDSYLAFGDGRFGLTASAMEYFWSSYAGNLERPHPCFAPLDANLAGLPPTFVNHAELDVLRDDSVELVARMRDVDISVEHRAYPGAIHGFTQYSKVSSLACRALDEAGAALRAALA